MAARPWREVAGELRELAAALGVMPREPETLEEFVCRCAAAARQLRRSAGVTWADYELARAQDGRAVFALREDSLRHPGWVIRVGESLEELAGKLGLYEDSR
jgi:hypothetical protein